MRRYTFLLLLLLIGLPDQAFAATVALESELGFYGHFQLDSWTPLTILLENRGRSVNGTLEVIVTSGNELRGDIQAMTYAMDVELPYNAKKSAAFTIRIDSFTHPLRLRLRHQDDVLAEQTINLRDGYTAKPFVVLVDEKVSPDALATFPEEVFPANVRPRFLPETWYGYDSVNMLVMNAEMLDALNSRQFEALTAWIQQGGTFVMTSGMNSGLLSASRLQGLLPLQALGSVRFQDVQAFQEFCGETLRSAVPLLALNVRIPQAVVLAQEQQTPLIMKKPIGAGQIIFIAFDAQSPPFSRWQGRAAFWQRIMHIQASLVHADAPRSDTQYLLTTLFSHIPARFPSASALIALFLCYLFLLKWFFYALSKRPERRLRHALSIVLFVAVSSAASYWFAADMRANVRQTRNSLLHLHLPQQRQIAAGEYVMGVYAMQAASYTLDFPGQSYPLTTLLPNDAPRKLSSPFRQYETPSGQQITGESDKWTHTFFSLTTSVELPIRAHAFETGDAMTFQAEHLSNSAIRDAYLTFRGNVYAVGDLSGEQAERLCQPIELGATTNFAPKNAINDASLLKTFFAHPAQTFSRLMYGENDLTAIQNAMQEDIAKKLMPRLIEVYRERTDVACLMGWMPETFVHPQLRSERTPAPSLTLLTWEIPVTP